MDDIPPEAMVPEPGEAQSMMETTPSAIEAETPANVTDAGNQTGVGNDTGTGNETLPGNQTGNSTG